ncbi:hypothetical protein M231_06446 [Tremella mesenterica]|uniref:Uncharacterized protein n=1 Tax=Tremella mesenterica TaxID=5217 RepID=A0A4V1M3B7_TREME|nr:hypothetical protein M231_06446 [Tremella mesenterica]
MSRIPSNIDSPTRSRVRTEKCVGMSDTCTGIGLRRGPHYKAQSFCDSCFEVVQEKRHRRKMTEYRKRPWRLDTEDSNQSSSLQLTKTSTRAKSSKTSVRTRKKRTYLPYMTLADILNPTPFSGSEPQSEVEKFPAISEGKGGSSQMSYELIIDGKVDSEHEQTNNLNQQTQPQIVPSTVFTHGTNDLSPELQRWMNQKFSRNDTSF